MKQLILLTIAATLITGIPALACEPHERALRYRERLEGRSWSVGGYTKHEYTGRDAHGNRIGGTIEELPSGTFRYKSWSKHNPVPGRVQRFLENRR